MGKLDGRLEGRPQEGSDLRLAMVALREPAALDAAHIRAALREVWPDHPPVQDVSADREVLGFQLGAATVVMGSLPTAIPWGDLERVAADAFTWPEATEVLQAHRAHVIVSVEGVRGDRVDGAMWLTRLVASVALHPGASGVYWGEGPQVSSPQDFVQAAREMTREQLPLYQWLGFFLWHTGDGRTSLATSGMRALGFMELELVDQRADAPTLVDRAFDIAHYLLDHGPVLDDGDTIGLSAQERVRCTHGPSMLEPGRNVYRLAL